MSKFVIGTRIPVLAAALIISVAIGILENPAHASTRLRHMKAIHQFFPPPQRFPPMLTVTGEALVPTPHATAMLVKAKPKGWNKKILILRLIIKRGSGSDTMTWKAILPYKEQTSIRYKQVFILPDKVSVRVHDIKR
jgi:hypothetical protein